MTVAYTGRPGVHNDGDGTTEGWFRSNQPKGDGGFVTTEPVGTEDWMPLNDYPTAKPTYDFHDTVAAGKTVLANGILQGTRRHPASAQFPHGSVTWHWHSAAPVASYLVEDSIGGFDLTKRTVRGMTFYQAQASSLSAARKAKNRVIMDKQPDITRFESMFSGPFPFTSDGVVVGRPSASFEEEMQTMITFAGGEIDTDTLYHENMHQWWGDHVTEHGYTMTFYKEGLATLAEFLFAARKAQGKAGGPGTAAGRRAFQRSLNATFASIYASRDSFWTVAPSNPTAWGLFSGSSTYYRPGIAYIALRQILGHPNFTRALEQIQREYGGARSPRPSWRRPSAAGCRPGAPPAASGWASSSPSGSTPRTRAAAGPPGRTSPVLGWPAPASTPAAARARNPTGPGCGLTPPAWSFEPHLRALHALVAPGGGRAPTALAPGLRRPFAVAAWGPAPPTHGGRADGGPGCRRTTRRSATRTLPATAGTPPCWIFSGTCTASGLTSSSS